MFGQMKPNIAYKDVGGIGLSDNVRMLSLLADDAYNESSLPSCSVMNFNRFE